MKKKELTRLIEEHLGRFFHLQSFYFYAGDTAYKVSEDATLLMIREDKEGGIETSHEKI